MAKKVDKKSEVSRDDLAWVGAGDAHDVALDGTKLVCRNAKTGKRLASVPKKAKQTDAAQQLLALRDWLEQHERECSDAVEVWMLRSLPVPRQVLGAVWDDSAWRSVLENSVVVPVDEDGELDQDAAGFFRGADAEKGLGVVNLDGETDWLDTELLTLPHPILLEELDDYRELAGELGLNQGISQLFRETWSKAADLDQKSSSVRDFADGKFEQLNFALGKCRTLGYRVRGGYAVCPVWEGGKQVEARYWIGADYPESETWTGDLLWVDEEERSLKLGEVGPVAYSEGVRMASAIYAARKVEEEGGS